mmetsp:Transcript_6231/g.26359  ORF Transcript_6231/g.26359 Transcript_6231/m.26359 type:complete len:92 (+) Transcript_6231:474-749(+)
MTPIFDLMVNDKLVDDIFSICLAEHGGVITLGDYDSQTMKSQITWVPMVTSYPPTFYTVSLPGIVTCLVCAGRTLGFNLPYASLSTMLDWR